MDERSDYPLPSHAASIWTVGDQIFIAFPPTIGQRGHTVRFTNSETGWEAVNNVLKDRERQKWARVIGTKAAPVQYDIEAMMKALAAGKPATHVPAVKKTKFDDSITLDDLEFDMDDLDTVGKK